MTLFLCTVDAKKCPSFFHCWPLGKKLLSVSLFTLSLFPLVHAPQAEAKRAKYSELQIKDYDDMRALLKTQFDAAAKSEQSGDEAAAVETLREAIVLVLSRPNSDNLVAKLMPDVKRELNKFNAFDDALVGVVSEAIRSLEGEGDKKLPVVYRATYLIMLENFISEFKPDLKEGNKDILTLFERIRDAKIVVAKDVQKDLKMRSMLKVPSPSDLAAKLLAPEAKKKN